jgi:chromosomal replication initiation ATPase DnaA
VVSGIGDLVLLIVDAFFVTPANALACEALDAAIRGDAEFRLLLLIGPRGAGKSSLLRRAAERLAGVDGVSLEDPLKRPLPSQYPDRLRVIATLDEADPDASALLRGFQERGGHVASLTVETELLVAVARATAAEMDLSIEPDALSLLVELNSAERIRGALRRLQAEAALSGVRTIDALFALRVLGDFIYPR